MALQGGHRQLFPRFRFTMDVDGFTSAAFQTVTGLRMTIGKAEYWEGGAFAAYKEPGRITFEDITCERGVSYDLDFYNWVTDVVNMLAEQPVGAGLISPLYKKNLNLLQRERDNSPSIRYNIVDGFPVEFDQGDRDNTSDEVAMESLTITYWYHTRENIGRPIVA